MCFGEFTLVGSSSPMRRECSAWVQELPAEEARVVLQVRHKCFEEEHETLTREHKEFRDQIWQATILLVGKSFHSLAENEQCVWCQFVSSCPLRLMSSALREVPTLNRIGLCHAMGMPGEKQDLPKGYNGWLRTQAQSSDG